MAETSRRYVPKTQLSDLEAQEIKSFIDSIQSKLSDNKIDFKEKKDIVYDSVGKLFKMLTVEQEYDPSAPWNIPAKDQMFQKEDEVYDIDSFGDINPYSKENINRLVTIKGFGCSTTTEKSIWESVQDPALVASMGLDMEELKKLYELTHKGGAELDSKKLQFMKMTQMVSKALSNPEIAKQIGRTPVVASQESIDAFNTKFSSEVIRSKETTPEQTDSFELFLTDGKAVTIGEYASDYISRKIEASKNAKEGTREISRAKNPEVAFACGLPGSGKSSIYVNQLKQRGFLCVDLDEIAVDLCEHYGMNLEESVEAAVYAAAGKISDSIVKKSMIAGYSICLEKIGHTKGQIEGMVNSVEAIEQSVAAEIGGSQPVYRKSLKMSACGSVSSAENNSIRNCEQIFSGEFLRAYDYQGLLFNNNSVTAAYLDVVADPKLRTRFDSMSIAGRSEKFHGLSLVGGNTSQKRMQENLATIVFENSQDIMDRE